MGKKIRHKYLTGSLLQPLFQFTNKLQFGVNPVLDPRGTAIANHYYRISKSIKPKFKAENFQANIQYDLQSSSSYIIFNFVNGWKKGYYLKQSTIREIDQSIHCINRIVQFQRTMLGFEDQYEDQQQYP